MRFFIVKNKFLPLPFYSGVMVGDGGGDGCVCGGGGGGRWSIFLYKA